MRIPFTLLFCLTSACTDGAAEPKDGESDPIDTETETETETEDSEVLDSDILDSETEVDTDDTDGVPLVDDDGDGTPNAQDCQPDDPQIHPGAPELCDGIDNACDGGDDDGTATWFPEAGQPSSFTATLAAGTSTTPAALTLDTPGRLALCPGTWYAHLTVEDAPVTIEGDDASTTVLDAAGSGRGIDARMSGHLELRALTLRGGEATTGGALALDSGTAMISDCVLTDNHADARGGAIYADDADLTIERSTLSDNRTDGSGGAVYFGGTGTFTTEQVEASDNTAGTLGGALHLNGPTWQGEDVVIARNQAPIGGGGVVLGDGLLHRLVGLELTDNTTEGDGGGLLLDATVLEVSGASTWSGNHAEVVGGAAKVQQGGELRLTDTVVHDNHATGGGGGLGLSAGTANLLRTTLSENTSDGAGGVHASGSIVQCTDGVVTDNVGGPGAGMNLIDSSLNAQGCTFSGQQSGGDGGALRQQGISTLTLEDCLFDDNVSFGLGAALYASGGTILATNTTFRLNEAGDGGGAMRLFGVSTILRQVVIERNSARIEGGGLAVRGGSLATEDLVLRDNLVTDVSTGIGGGAAVRDATLTWSNATVQDNEAQDGGGLFVRGGTASIALSALRDNLGLDRGGALYVFSGQVMLDQTTIAGNEADFGGGIYVAPTADVRLLEVDMGNNLPDDVRSGGSYDFGVATTVSCDGVDCQ
jgi:fibronectin-binding autotransporter adhesin